MKLRNSSGKGSRSFPQFLAAATAAGLFVMLLAVNVQSQAAKSRQVTVTLSAADYTAAAAARNVKIHARPANTPIGRATSVAAISESCEIIELRYPTDTVGYACTRSATQHCDDCGIGLCSKHSEKCDRCALVFCSGCLSFHIDSAHAKPAVIASPRITEKRSA
jgi:hypothetical protein